MNGSWFDETKILPQRISTSSICRMKRKKERRRIANRWFLVATILLVANAFWVHALPEVAATANSQSGQFYLLQADDYIVASSLNSPLGQGVSNAIDQDVHTKY